MANAGLGGCFFGALAAMAALAAQVCLASVLLTTCLGMVMIFGVCMNPSYAK